MNSFTQTFGPAYSEELDGKRIQKQHEEIRDYMLCREWRTLAEIASALRYPEASVSAQLRHLRKARFGGHVVEKRRRLSPSGAQWEYRVRSSDSVIKFNEEGQGEMTL